MVEVLDIYGDDFDYVLRGHNLSNQDIEQAVKQDRDDLIAVISKYETWCHWCYGTWEGESNRRYCIFDKKYKGVRGGFPITVVDNTEQQ